MRRCFTCLCRTCLNTCRCTGCKQKVESCDRYNELQQLDIFDKTETKNQIAPRHSWSHYGITKERYRQLTEYIQSGEYASLASQAAHKANKMIAGYILLSVTKNKSYDAIEKMWCRGEIERIPCCRTDFYGYRRYFFSIFDKGLRRIGK